jgi:hypothetical protein
MGPDGVLTRGLVGQVDPRKGVWCSSIVLLTLVNCRKIEIMRRSSRQSHRMRKFQLRSGTVVCHQGARHQLLTLAPIQPSPPANKVHCGTLTHDDAAPTTLVAGPNILKGTVIVQPDMGTICLSCGTYYSFFRNNPPICQL